MSTQTVDSPWYTYDEIVKILGRETIIDCVSKRSCSRHFAPLEYLYSKTDAEGRSFASKQIAAFRSLTHLMSVGAI